MHTLTPVAWCGGRSWRPMGSGTTLLQRREAGLEWTQAILPVAVPPHVHWERERVISSPPAYDPVRFGLLHAEEGSPRDHAFGLLRGGLRIACR